MILELVFALIIGAPQQGGSAESQTAIEQRAHDEYERYKQAAIRINELAGRIQSEADASALVSEIAVLFAKELPPAWASGGIRQRVAHAEYEAVRDPARRIAEQRVVDVWNHYVREIGAPDEALVTAAEIHNLRDAELTAAQYLWARGSQTVWTMPKVYDVGTDGKIADGCRAIEAIRVIYDLDRFQNLRSARELVIKGILASEQVKDRSADSIPKSQGGVLLATHAEDNPVRSAERGYLQDHGSLAYDQLVIRLFDELFPDE